MKIQKTPYFSYRLGSLPRGCRYCVKGQKLVLFVTGLCPRSCYFCPVSEQKYQKDVVLANERPVHSFKDIRTEACLMQAKGAGLTGGDPLTRLPRTLDYIRKLKKTFGKKFHLHLYTSLNLVTEKNLRQLYQAGLDEIRFHLDLDDKTLWPKLSLAGKFPWAVGVEVPLIPGKQKQLKELINFIHDKISFLNLNELEIADTPACHLAQLGFQTENKLSYAIKDSLELGLRLFKYIQKKNYDFNVHLCTAKLKDAVQLTNRIKRESKKAKKPFDLLDSEGLLTRGALYLPELTPSFSYHQKLKALPKNKKAKILKRLNLLKNKIKKELKLPPDQIFLDPRRPRILLSKKNLLKNKSYFKNLNLRPALVREYPTYDQFEVELEFC